MVLRFTPVPDNVIQRDTILLPVVLQQLPEFLTLVIAQNRLHLKHDNMSAYLPTILA